MHPTLKLPMKDELKLNDPKVVQAELFLLLEQITADAVNTKTGEVINHSLFAVMRRIDSILFNPCLAIKYLNKGT